MKSLVLIILALGVLGACKSEPKDEVGRYLPLTSAASGAIVDTKTGIIYEYRYDIERYTPYGKKPIRVLITKVNPISKEVINFYSDIKIGK